MELSLAGVPVRLTSTTVLAVVLCLGAIGYGGYDYVQQSQAIEEATTVNATVVETDIEQDSAGRGIEYDVTVVFTYEYDGSRYESDRLYPTTFSPTFETESKAESVLAPYDRNETVTAYLEPSNPDGAFLEARRTTGPLWLAGGGGLILLLTVLNAAGARTPGQGVELRPVGESRDRTLFGLDGETVHRLSRRVIAGSVGLVVASLLGAVLILLGAEESSIQAGVTDPAGIALLSAFAGVFGVLGGLLVYVGWSFTAYRRLRERIVEPRPPSPFVRPTRLVTILKTSDDDLGEYGRRVKRTGFALVAVAFVLCLVLQVLVV